MSNHPRTEKRRAVVAAMARAAVVLAALATVVLHNLVLSAGGHGAPPLPTQGARPPAIRPLPLPTVTPGTPPPDVTESPPAQEKPAAPGVLPERTPAPEAAPTAIAAGRAYRVRGSLAVTAHREDGTSATDRRTYEVAFAPVADAVGPGVNRSVRLWSGPAGAGEPSIALYEVGSAAVVVAGPSYWRIQARDAATPLSQAIEPVLALARLAYAACRDAGGSTPAASEGSDGEACLLTDSDRVADLLAANVASVSVTSSQLVARLDLVHAVVLRYLFTAQLEIGAAPAASIPGSYAIEWSYEYVPGDGTASSNTAWPARVPQIGDAGVPGLEKGILPAPERLVAVESAGGVHRLELAMPEDEARSELARLLREAGWRVRQREGTLNASRGDESLVVGVGEGATEGNTVLDFVPDG